MSPHPDNLRVAERLAEAARLLHSQGASPYRVHAYQRAGESVARDPRDVRRVFDALGAKGLDALPDVGLGIAAAIGEMLVTDRWDLLERLRGEADPVTLFQGIPGVGASLARHIAETLHVDSLEELRAAAEDGRLARVPRVGVRRAAHIRASLDAMLGARAEPVGGARNEPPVGLLLDIDAEYRGRAAAGTLRAIAPRRFNPAGERWLPVLHAERAGWHFTALFSNTALAHRMERVRDWVVIYFYDGDHRERHCTVVTEFRGPFAGLRIVRGREAECARHQAGRLHELHSDQAA